ncbi:MAG: hypothetical protein U1F33_11935 [Alphaproteobacteria bacterium]
MRTDHRGLPVSTDSPAAMDAINHFACGLPNYAPGLDAVITAAEAHPDCGLLQIHAALLFTFSQNASVIEKSARPFLARARAATLNDRERSLLEVAEAWSRSDFARAKAILAAYAWPRDLIAAKVGEFLYFEAPDPERHRAFMDRLAEANRDSSDFLAMHAFAHELAGDRSGGEEIAERALALDPDTPWADHALAHIYVNTGRMAEGIARLGRAAPAWEAHDFGIRVHLWWHAALFHLAALDLARVRALFAERLWVDRLDDMFTHTDAISLLWRLDLVGASDNAAWAAVVPRAEAVGQEAVFPFLACHYVYALARGGREREARQVLAAMRARGQAASGDAARHWLGIGVPLAEGCLASATGDHARAASVMAPVMDEAGRIGGSDAQNDVLAQTWIVALARSGQRDKANAAVMRRVGARPLTPQEEAWLEVAREVAWLKGAGRG